jgi:hypothetical protein
VRSPTGTTTMAEVAGSTLGPAGPLMSTLVDRGIDDLARFLEGAWRVSRELVPVHGALPGGFDGRATFSWVERTGELVYEEWGTARIGEHVGSATRCLRYETDGPVAVVRFDDGRFFHDLDLRDGSWHADHPCGHDLYCGRFTVTGPHAWEQHWTVTGPTETYHLRTRLVREHRYPGADEPGS